MIIIAAVDNKGGMMFNHRRLSEDSVLKRKILELSKSSQLWMNSYSLNLFQGMEGSKHVRVDEDFVERAMPGEFCYVENIPVAPYEPEIGRIILFRWNRDYPRDFCFDIDVQKAGWKLTRTEEFVGSSHDKITMEEYIAA